MRAIRFRLEGLFHSFRVPFFKTYHKSFLIPPKSTIIGLLCNISLKSQREFFKILDNNLIDIAVVLDEYSGKAKDLWQYKLYEKKNNGTSVIRRDKLYRPKYSIYLSIQNQNLFDEIYSSLKMPKNIPALGLDDEIITIKDVDIIELKEGTIEHINSSILVKKPKIDDIVILDKNNMQMPTFFSIPTKFTAYDKKGNRVSKAPKEEFLQIEFYNCAIKIDTITPLYDKELNYGLVFS